MDSIDYTALYALQDKVMQIVFEREQEFYLTGGTCLSRFYHEKRYSDDLDFFTHSSPRFSFAVKNIKQGLSKDFMVTSEVESRDFVRLKIDKRLQIDFINDRTERYGEPLVLENGYIIDTIENILSNKITAVIGRDDPKDIFDIYLICHYYSFDWQVILSSSLKKSTYRHEDLIIRLKSFPVKLLDHIKTTDKAFLDDFQKRFPSIIQEINRKDTHQAIQL